MIDFVTLQSLQDFLYRQLSTFLVCDYHESSLASLFMFTFRGSVSLVSVIETRSKNIRHNADIMIRKKTVKKERKIKKFKNNFEIVIFILVSKTWISNIFDFDYLELAIRRTR